MNPLTRFQDLNAPIGHDLSKRLLESLGIDSSGLYQENPEGGPGTYLDLNNQLAGFDPSQLDGYGFTWNPGKKRSGTLQAYDQDGGQVFSGYQAPDKGFAKTMLTEALPLAAAAFGGLGLAGMGPLSGLSNMVGAAGAPGAAAGMSPEAMAFLESNMGAFAPVGSSGAASAAPFFVGEGVSSGVPIWDAAIKGGSGLAGKLSAAGLPALGNAFAGGGSLLPGLGGISGNALLSVGGNLLGGLLQSNAANKAAKYQLQAGNNALDLARETRDMQRADFAPYREAGVDALSQIRALLANPSSVTAQPDYRFGLEQGTRALENSAAARGGLYSGSAMKAAQKFGSDYAGSKLDQSYNRLSNIAGLGQVGASGSAGAAGQFGQTAGGIMQNMGNVRGAGAIGSANAWGNALGNALNGWREDDLLRRLGIGGP